MREGVGGERKEQGFMKIWRCERIIFLGTVASKSIEVWSFKAAIVNRPLLEHFILRK